MTGDADLEGLKKREDECLCTIGRTTLTMIVFSLFCVLTLGAPDRQLFEEGLVVTIPLADTNVGFGALLAAAPIVLLALWRHAWTFRR